MNPRLVLLLLCLVALVGVVNADTLIVYTTGTEDGFFGLSGVNHTLAEMRPHVGNSYVDTTAVTARSQLESVNANVTGYYQRIYRGYIEFNTSAIPDTAVISSATVGLTGHATTYSALGTPTYGLTLFRPLTNGTASTADYANKEDYYLSDTQIAGSSWSTTGYNNYTLNTLGLSNVSKTGYTNYMWRQSWDIGNETGLTWSQNKISAAYYQTQEHGATGIPFIEITYSTVVAPVASFTSSNQTPCSNQSIQFNDTSTNTPTDWDWYFWDNETKSSDLQNPAYTFPVGVHNIRLYASNSGGGDWQNETAFINVTNCAPTPGFFSNVTCGNVPFTVQFNDTSTRDPVVWNWSFGDGNYSENQNPVFEYNLTGLFTINLSASNYNGTGWLNRSEYIRAVPDWYICPIVVTTTIPLWTPVIMPSTEIQTQGWYEWILSMWWLWILIVIGFILVKK